MSPQEFQCKLDSAIHLGLQEYNIEAQVSLEAARCNTNEQSSDKGLKIPFSSIYCCFLSLQHKINLSQNSRDKSHMNKARALVLHWCRSGARSLKYFLQFQENDQSHFIPSVKTAWVGMLLLLGVWPLLLQQSEAHHRVSFPATHTFSLHPKRCSGDSDIKMTPK